MYVCETWSVTLREEHRFRTLENRALRRIFVPEREEEAGGWRRLHNEELHNLYASPNIVRMMTTWAEHVASMGEMRNAYKIFIGKYEWTRPFGRPKRRREGNIRMDLKETGWENVGCMRLAEDKNQWRAVVNTVMNLRVS
jgi:hypothetical protein